ncbi:MAG: DUF4403 family protein [Myxococcales bacterium]
MSRTLLLSLLARPRARFDLALACLFVAACVVSACAHRPPLPVLPPPAVRPRTDGVPPLPLSTLVVPLAVPLSGVQDVLRQRLVIPSVKDWQQVTPPGESPEVGIRYQAELGAARFATTGSLVRTSLPIHYYGSFRVRAKTPLGWLWLAKNVAWGSKDKRGTIELAVDSELSVSPAWQLSTRSSLGGVTLTAPDVEKLCAGKIVKVCVPVEVVRDRLHRELDKQVRERASAGLAELDGQAAARTNLAGIAQEVWSRLQASVAQGQGDPLWLRPEGMALSSLVVSDDALRSELRVWARPGWGTSVSDARPLPAAAELGPPAEDVYFDTRLGLQAVSDGFSHILSALPANGDDIRLERIDLLGPAEAPGRWLVAMRLADDDRSATVYGDALLLPEERALRLSELQLTEASTALVVTAGFKPATFVELVDQAARCALDEVLDGRLAAVRGALAESVAPWPVSFSSSTRASVQAAYADQDHVLLRVRAH